MCVCVLELRLKWRAGDLESLEMGGMENELMSEWAAS